MKRVVHVVTEGEYSDYRVLCAFEAEADAQAHVEDRNTNSYGDARVETFTLYGPGEAPQRYAWWRVSATVNARGETEAEREHHVVVWDEDGERAPDRPRTSMYKVRADAIRVVVDALDYDDAYKVYGDTVARALAKIDPSIV